GGEPRDASRRPVAGLDGRAVQLGRWQRNLPVPATGVVSERSRCAAPAGAAGRQSARHPPTSRWSDPMKISDVSVHVLGTPWRDLTYVTVHTDEGLVGVGETRMLSHTEALKGYLAEATVNHVLGSDPFDIESL